MFLLLEKLGLNILPHIIWGMINAESSKVKRIRRFFNNNLFDSINFYDYIIKHVIANYKKKHKDNRVHIIFDHMFSHDNYTVFMISMRIGNQGIPL